MERAEKLSHLEASLEIVADKLGDINPLILAQYHQRFPSAKEHFTFHGAGDVSGLEISMVETTVYTLLTWYERPLEVEITMADTVPHHVDLKIPDELFVGLIDVTVEVITSALDEQHELYRSLWAELKNELLELVEQSKEA